MASFCLTGWLKIRADLYNGEGVSASDDARSLFLGDTTFPGTLQIENGVVNSFVPLPWIDTIFPDESKAVSKRGLLFYWFFSNKY